MRIEKKPSHDREPLNSGPRPAAPAAPAETGWLPDLVYTGEKFEAGLAFFADALGRITRFSREPADLAAARRLPGQAALPGLVNAHSHSFHRVVRGRAEKRGKDGDPRAAWREMLEGATARLSDEGVFDAARMVFMEMLLSGITCVGEFHYLHRRPDGTAWDEPNYLAQEVIRAARDVGIRIALLPAAWLRRDFRGNDPAPVWANPGSAEHFVREAEALRVALARNYPADEAWLGIAAQGLAAVPLPALKTIASYAHAQRMRLHVHVSAEASENAACVAEYGRTPIALLVEHGLLDKRFTAIDAIHLTEDEIKLLGTARASVGVCPTSNLNLGLGLAPADRLLAAGAGVALGSDSQVQVDLLKEARSLEYHWRGVSQRRAVVGPDPATALFHAATVAGARSLGATSGALAIGRPADFFTVNLFDPAIAGAEPESLLANIVLGLERRAIRDVWVGARQRLANGRHVLHGAIVGRFVDLQQRLWPK